jgi:CHAT domain-containing protein
MVKSKKVTIIFILIIFLGGLVFSREEQNKADNQLREQILAAYQPGGEQGLLDFVKKEKDKISNKFIVDFAESGVNERKEEWLKTCEIIAEEKRDEKTLADVLYQTGKYLSLISDYEKAADCFDKALSSYIKLNDPVGQGNVYWNKGNVYFQIGENTKAIEIFDKALPFFKKAADLIGQGNVYQRKGVLYHRIGENSRALEMFDKALPFFEKAGDPLGQGNVYLGKGVIYYRIGENSSAFTMLDKALFFFEKGEDLNGQGNVYFMMADINSTIGSNLKATEMLDKALLFFEKAGQLIGQGNVYYGKGVIYSSIGDNPRALEMYDKALFFFEKTGQLVGQGNVYYKKGRIYHGIGNNSKAIEMADKALVFFEKGVEPFGQGNVYDMKGDIYSSIGDNSKALEMVDKALAFFEKIEHQLGLGNGYVNKGEIYLNIGDNSKAIEMLDKALPFFEKAGAPLGQGNVYGIKGDIYFRIGNYSKTIEMVDKALLFFEKAEDLIGQGNVYLIKGEIYSRIGDNSRALEMYNKAMPFYEKTGSTRNESCALHGKAAVLVKLGKKDEALNLFEKGIDNLERIRRQTAFSKMKQTYMECVYDAYQESVMFMLENNFYEKGFTYAESMISRVFLDQMAEGLVPLDKGLNPQLKEERDKVVGKLSTLSRKMQETPGKEEKKLLELKEEYRRVESQFDDLLIKIRLENHLYASVNYPQPVSVRDLQTDVLKKGESLVSFFIAPGKAYAFIVSKENFKVKPLPVNEKEIDGYVQRYLQAIKENHTNEMNRLGSLLYEKLFKPLEKYLKKTREIIIVPSGPLETTPFESLIASKRNPEHPVYLLEKYRLKYVQGATLLSILRKHYTNTTNTGANTSKSFIGFGDPVYDYENFKQGKPEQGTMKILATESTEVTESIFSHEDTRSGTKEKSLYSVPSVSSVAIEDEIKEIHRHRYARAGGIMDRLPNSGAEIQSIARLFEKQSLKGVVNLREQATEDNARAANMKDFDYIHFSCHGLLNDDFQSLVLSQLPREKSKEDGYFTLNEIMNCDYNAKLVVLSACETGSGKMYKGEGVTGLTRAVMYAGTPAVVASLWKVDDIATKELMVNFYRNMLEKKMDKVEALRQAKLELLKNENYRSPLYWSAFVMYGE